MKWTLDKQLFAGLAVVVFLFNCTLLMDFAWLFQGAETSLANEVVKKNFTSPIGWILEKFSAGDPLNLVGFRLPGLLIGLLGLLALTLIIRKILGNTFTLLFFLAMVNNYFFLGIMKVATADIWSLVFQSIGIVSLIRFMKTPTLLWRIISYSCIAISIWLHPLTSSMLFLILPSIYYIFSEQGKRLIAHLPWLLVIGVLILLYFTGQLQWLVNDHYLGWGQSGFGTFLIVILVGALPLLGFLIAGIVASAKNIRKSEEFSLLFLSWLVIALLVQSPSAIVVMNIFIAKHIQDFFHKNYPYGKYIKAYSTLHLIVFFFVAAFLMLGGFFIFRGTGFRSGLAFSFVYWVLSFIMVIGVFGENRRFLYAGAFLTGMLTTTLFCIQLFPLLENQRIHRSILNSMEEKRITPDWILYQDEKIPIKKDNLLFYLNQKTNGTVVDEKEEGKVGLQLLLKSTPDSMDVSGWRDNFQRQTYQLKKEI